MNKTIALFLSVLLLASSFIFTSCDNEKGGKAANTTTTTSEESMNKEPQTKELTFADFTAAKARIVNEGCKSVTSTETVMTSAMSLFGISINYKMKETSTESAEMTAADGDGEFVFYSKAKVQGEVLESTMSDMMPLGNTEEYEEEDYYSGGKL